MIYLGGIDITPKTIEKFRNAKDEISAILLGEILKVSLYHYKNI